MCFGGEKWVKVGVNGVKVGCEMGVGVVWG